MQIGDILRYFAHGIFFSFLLVISAFMWAYVFELTVVVATYMGVLIIGLAIALDMLFIVIGLINSILANILWEITCESDWGNALGHGLLLYIVLYVAKLPSVLVYRFASGLVIDIVLIIVYALVDGFIAKQVSKFFEKEARSGDDEVESQLRKRKVSRE